MVREEKGREGEYCMNWVSFVEWFDSSLSLNFNLILHYSISVRIIITVFKYREKNCNDRIVKWLFRWILHWCRIRYSSEGWTSESIIHIIDHSSPSNPSLISFLWKSLSLPSVSLSLMLLLLLISPLHLHLEQVMDGEKGERDEKRGRGSRPCWEFCESLHFFL